MTSPPTQSSFLATGRGRLTLLLLASIGFMDFIDASIVNIALPHIRDDLDFSVQDLQWVLSAYLLTYGGFMLLGGRAGDLIGRRRVLVTGTVIFGLASFAGGFADSPSVLVGARLVQGLGAALMMPTALSLLTTSFSSGSDRTKALGVWGGVAGLASAAGVFLGGVLTEGPGWRWVLYVNPPISALLLIGIYALVPGESRRASWRDLDLPGSVLVTGGMVLLVLGLIKAPEQGWGSGRTVFELAGAAVLLCAFVVVELRTARPLIPMSALRIPGLAAANLTQLIGVGGFVTMFFFLTLYMQNVLGYSALETGASYLPLTFGVGVSAGVGTALISKIGTRPVIVGGALITAAGLFYLAQIPVDGSYLSDLLPGLMIVSLGIGGVFVGATTAANAGVPERLAGLAAALVNSSQQVGGALGLAIFSAIATARTNDLLGGRGGVPQAMTSGFQRALTAAAIFLVAAALIATRAKNNWGEQPTQDETAAHAGEPAGVPSL
ncbi:MFS transporter [Luteipulveratus mongoliensis]|uniref:MFS transporter n=1 Tax=Luteipulveratus mongoliensis TaxID=571913 RepID=A0A0K1JER2_9MICO|nr:MFS transporter [Luteipulveratus mongoliensis]AKU15083.1 MFS transporter [Luteipulveratus mongoliensis]